MTQISKMSQDLNNEMKVFKNKIDEIVKAKREEISKIKSKNRCKKCPLCLEGFTGEFKNGEEIIDQLRKQLKAKETEIENCENKIIDFKNVCTKLSECSYRAQKKLLNDHRSIVIKAKEQFEIAYREAEQEKVK